MVICSGYRSEDRGSETLGPGIAPGYKSEDKGCETSELDNERILNFSSGHSLP